jgi:hypothetical protein
MPNTSQGIWNHQTKLHANANALEECLEIEIEPDPNKISQRHTPIKYASMIQTSSKRGKGHHKDHFWQAELWRGDLGRLPTKQKPRAYKKLESTRHHATSKSNSYFHPKKFTWH